MGLLHMELPRPSLFTCKSSRAGDTLFCLGSTVTAKILSITMPSIVSELQDFILATGQVACAWTYLGFYL